eukprot:TRINITY_DN66115_c0_g2_i1.p1 TRINITY_DN66115_c0_g2~~TRINITY_DN66115_c0_g2_i1.p1  ORF type:complete len:309 (+),score=45.06 TRINITY_DN66115_c0_g2_i1:93-929(+)
MAAVVNGTPHVAKVEAFRSFASQLAGQVVEQLCQEFEREVAIMFEDILQYREELRRVADLLGSQLHRERQLHDMLETMAGHHANIHEAAHIAARQQPGTAALHDLVDQLFGQHQAALGSTLKGADTARSIAETHAMSSSQLQEPLISAENEYTRIMQLLSVPLVPDASPSPVILPATTSPPILSGSSTSTLRPVGGQVVRQPTGSYVQGPPQVVQTQLVSPGQAIRRVGTPATPVGMTMVGVGPPMVTASGPMVMSGAPVGPIVMTAGQPPPLGMPIA